MAGRQAAGDFSVVSCLVIKGRPGGKVSTVSAEESSGNYEVLRTFLCTGRTVYATQQAECPLHTICIWPSVQSNQCLPYQACKGNLSTPAGRLD